MSVKLVKSVHRTMEILELFNTKRKPMPAIEIAKELGYPLASTHEILKTLTELDYLRFGAPKWAYVPTKKFPSVVDWVNDLTEDYSRLLEFMVALNEATKETINLSRRTGQHVKIVHGYECRHQIGVSSKPGTIMPVTQSLTGLTCLAAMTDEARGAFMERLQSLDPHQHEQLDEALLNDVVQEVRRYGSAMRCDLRVEGIGALCVPIKSEAEQKTLIIGIVGPSDRLRKHAAEHYQSVFRLLQKFQVRTVYDVHLPS